MAWFSWFTGSNEERVEDVLASTIHRDTVLVDTRNELFAKLEERSAELMAKELAAQEALKAVHDEIAEFRQIHENTYKSISHGMEMMFGPLALPPPKEL